MLSVMMKDFACAEYLSGDRAACYLSSRLWFLTFPFQRQRKSAACKSLRRGKQRQAP
jgi:hypothetical protein